MTLRSALNIANWRKSSRQTVEVRREGSGLSPSTVEAPTVVQGRQSRLRRMTSLSSFRLRFWQKKGSAYGEAPRIVMGGEQVVLSPVVVTNDQPATTVSPPTLPKLGNLAAAASQPADTAKPGAASGGSAPPDPPKPAAPGRCDSMLQADGSARPPTPRYASGAASSDTVLGGVPPASSASSAERPAADVDVLSPTASDGPALQRSASDDAHAVAARVEEITLRLDLTDEIASAAVGVGDEDGDDAAAAAQLSDADAALVEAAVAAERPALRRALALCAAQWTIACGVLPDDEQPPPLASRIQTTLRERKAALLSAATPAAGGRAWAGTPSAVACDACWRLRVSQLCTELAAPDAAAAARESSRQWAGAVLEAQRDVMKSNLDRLDEHMRRLLEEKLAADASELVGSRLSRVVHARAFVIHRMLTFAMDDVATQLRAGFASHARPAVERPPAASADAEPPLTPPTADELDTLCAAAVAAFRHTFERPWRLPTLEAELLRRIAAPSPEPSAAAPSTEPDADPVGWLLSLVLGAAELPLRRDDADFLLSVVATYLDPFIDGDVPPEAYASRTDVLFMRRLAEAWAARESGRVGGGDAPMPVSTGCALAAYCAHAITKMNANLCFGPHQPGTGRQPASPGETDRHLRRLASSLLAAMRRDFPDAEANGPLATLSEADVVHVGQLHVRAIFEYQAQLGRELLVVNRVGDERRLAERIRIWGKE